MEPFPWPKKASEMAVAPEGEKEISCKACLLSQHYQIYQDETARNAYLKQPLRSYFTFSELTLEALAAKHNDAFTSLCTLLLNW